jgi:uncharacterized protein (TIGR03437 family)
MTSKSWFWKIGLAIGLTASAWAGTFGKVVPIGGQASDLALDEGRGVLYVANFTANRIEVISLSDNTVLRSINVASQPSSIALSPDFRYLLIAHYGNFAAPTAPNNALTVINLESNERQTFSLDAAPFGVAFGLDSRALVATAKNFILFDPATGTSEVLDTVVGITSKTLPQPTGSFPLTITAASIATSRDGTKIFGISDTIQFGYDVLAHRLQANGYSSTPTMGPRVVSVSQDGSVYTAGWALFDGNLTMQGIFSMISEFPGPSGALNIGSHAIDSSRNVIYAQIPAAAGAAPVLQIVDADNLAVRERLQLPENLAGKSVLSGDSNVLYSLSDSGVLVLPVGALDQTRRVVTSREDVVFRGNFCNRQIASQQLTISDVSGASTDFTIKSSDPAVKINPASGVTPATISITVDPAAFQTQKGTVTATLTIQSGRAVNQIQTVRVLVNNHEPEQRGSFVNVPGKLVDILADPSRNRFYILRQDKNQVLVFDAGTNTQIGTLRTGNTPTQMAITFDGKNMLVGSNDSQVLYVYDLDTLQALAPIRMPAGHYPKSVASAGNTILVANRVAGPKHVIDRVDLASGTATQLPSLGVFQNDVNINTTLVASPNGSSILAAEADGTVLLFSAVADTFTVARKDVASLSGAYAASSYNQFVVGNTLLNASLVPVNQIDTGNSSGFSFIDQMGLRTTATGATSPGMIQRIDPLSGNASAQTPIIEAPVLSDTVNVFTRTLAPLANRSGIVALTISGFTILPWNFDANVAVPRIDQVTNSADHTSAVAPEGLISITGANLSGISQSFAGGTLPTNLADSCLQINGNSIPVIAVSPTQINAQLPSIDGTTVLRLVTPGGVVDNFSLTISPTAPAIFRVNLVGLDTPVPAIVRSANNQVVTPSNPVHRTDVLTIFATGMGRTLPDTPVGSIAPTDSLFSVAIPPVITVGGQPVEVLFAGLAPGQVGVYQINVRMNNQVPLGLSLPLQITQGGGSTSVSVRVVQ